MRNNEFYTCEYAIYFFLSPLFPSTSKHFPFPTLHSSSLGDFSSKNFLLEKGMAGNQIKISRCGHISITDFYSLCCCSLKTQSYTHVHSRSNIYTFIHLCVFLYVYIIPGKNFKNDGNQKLQLGWFWPVYVVF